ncbi:hypothetical protein [Sporosarcina sp. E16_8]|uniref:hypothetical protein n=1 Tax=Sporosarcina sp. E16_8 TaxID=2789295 RepID=UPI001A9244F1|nr:hypothetical protein [Sporosarcina sp. E16_8]MBO0588601.1 hypothetical protein [Sporosarcina sp. E16_8]
MYKQLKIPLILFLTYCLSYLMLSTVFYTLSLSQGKDGLELAFFGGGDDGAIYAEQAGNIANSLPAVLTSIHAWILGQILKLFNSESIFLLKLFNITGNFFLLITALFTLRKTVGVKKESGTGAAILILFLLYYPSLLLNSTLSIYRDVWICFYYLLSIYLFSTLWIVKSRCPFLLNFILLMASVGMLGGYREYALLSFLIGSICYLIFIGRKNSRLSFKKIIMAIVVGFSIAYTFLRDTTIPYVNLSFQTVLDYRHSPYNIGGSQMNISLDQPNVFLFAINYFHSFISNVLGPLPWQINSGATLLVFFSETLLFLSILLFLFRRRKQFGKMDLLLILHSTAWFMLIAISNDNLGTTARLRMVGWIPLFIVFTKHYSEYYTRKKGLKLQEMKKLNLRIVK